MNHSSKKKWIFFAVALHISFSDEDQEVKIFCCDDIFEINLQF
jgi:hypothetical protein